MGMVVDNYIMSGVSGKVGGLLVFRQRGGRTIIAKAPRKYDIKSEKRKAASDRFRDAAKFAKKALFDKELNKHYKLLAGKNRSAYNVALGDYLELPAIDLILTGTYTGAIGSNIIVFLKKGKAVKAIRVSITDKEGSVLESGLAVQEGATTQYSYTAILNNDIVSGSVIVEVTDFAGNTIVKTVTIGDPSTSLRGNCAPFDPSTSLRVNSAILGYAQSKLNSRRQYSFRLFPSTSLRVNLPPFDPSASLRVTPAQGYI